MMGMTGVADRSQYGDWWCLGISSEVRGAKAVARG